ncbi:MAG: sigma-54-dependent Fis family transcriptional regulator [Chromatiaceae bacterium]|nr:sigma-54-dependent Fis family transcriptional regulator [Chromatiaceae bacterium]MCP5423175.1 sigma-54-dependent Fis family transcriptional regulator [Chromatiaceae bacterium]
MNAIGNPQVMLIDDEEHIRVAASQALDLAGYGVQAFERADRALAVLDADWPGAIVSDIRMPGIDGLQFLQHARAIDPDLPVILITGHGDVSMAVEAMRAGAYDFIEKPFAVEDLVDTVARALEKRTLTIENRRLKNELAVQSKPGPRIIGDTVGVQRLRQTIAQIADTDADVLVNGETGTGKELVARALHENSRRRERNFVAVNCGAVPDNLIESELFGHEAGAFTDARTRRIGKFEHANGGTLFLDEIESMPMNVQVHLLRVLQERAIERLGSNELVSLDLRVVAASKTDLREAAARGEFREDLYYRLSVVMIDIPPLRERREDIPLLFQHFVLVAGARYQREPPPPRPEQLHRLMLADWPGNVRELRNAAERYVLLGESCGYDVEQMIGAAAAAPAMSLPQQIECFERGLIEQQLKAHNGCIKDTMAALGLPRKTLYDKMKKYGLERDDYT